MLPTFTPQDALTTPRPASPLRESLHAWLATGWRAAGFEAEFPADAWDACPVPEADLTHAGALLAARALKSAPRKIAEAWAANLAPNDLVAKVEVVGPGHLNVRLTDAALVLLLDGASPFAPSPDQPPILLEFVSANPTGPLHLGHARQGVLGSTLANLLRKQGWVVGTEFYSNDAGVQIDMLVTSASYRMKGLLGSIVLFERNLDEQGQYSWAPEEYQPPDKSLRLRPEIEVALPEALWFPKGGYHGADIIELARAALLAGISPDNTADLKPFLVNTIAANQKATLDRLRVSFDSFASERAFQESGEVQRVLDALLHHAYRALVAEQETAPPKEGAKPAWFLRTTAYGDDKDRVIKKYDGSVPYFVPDVAYHLNKLARGWDQAINIQGSDHHGTLARVRAGVQFALGPPDYPQAIFHTMVSVIKDGQPLVASKRAGTALPADAILDMIGPDAFRMSLLSSGPTNELVVDIDAWQAQGMSNPVYALQYAAARLNTLLDKSAAAVPGSEHRPEFTPGERALAKAVLVFDDRLQRAALAMDPVRPAQFLKELASLTHSAYEQAPRLVQLDEASRQPHTALFRAALSALRRGHEVLGLEAPDKMEPLRTPAPKA